MSYTASHGTLTAKPLSPSTGVPTDGRTYYEDAANFLWRPFQNTAEVLAFLNTSAKRTGHTSIWINSGGTLNVGQSGFAAFTGGTYNEYVFKDGVADNNLVIKNSSSQSSKITLTGVNPSTQILAGTLIEKYVIITDVVLTGFKVGLTTGAQDLLTSMDIDVGINIIDNNSYIQNTSTIHFTNTLQNTLVVVYTR